MRIRTISQLGAYHSVCLFHMIMNTPSPAKDLNTYFLSRYVCSGSLVPLIQRISKTIPPVVSAYNRTIYAYTGGPHYGVIDV